MTKLLNFIILLCISAIGVALSLVNTAPVELNYYFDIVQLPLSILLILSFSFGVLICLILLIPTLIKYRFFPGKKVNQQFDSTEDLPLIKPASLKPDTIENKS
ncbi:MAG: DUF1049 domain-containing protein [Gammaproteobacteria bacterium]|nr:DUF1049 domain-containing protein [Gammaproteobacteria bacterium]